MAFYKLVYTFRRLYICLSILFPKALQAVWPGRGNHTVLRMFRAVWRVGKNLKCQLVGKAGEVGDPSSPGLVTSRVTCRRGSSSKDMDWFLFF